MKDDEECLAVAWYAVVCVTNHERRPIVSNFKQCSIFRFLLLHILKSLGTKDPSSERKQRFVPCASHLCLQLPRANSACQVTPRSSVPPFLMTYATWCHLFFLLCLLCLQCDPCPINVHASSSRELACSVRLHRIGLAEPPF